MTIKSNIEEVITKIIAEVDAGLEDKEVATEVGDKAVAAILGGAAEWAAYMKLFAKTPEELARLIPTDGTADETKQKARAYLVANGTCGSGTTRGLLHTVENKLNL
ncbi:MAG TPA: hypothetical protein VF240_13135 [Pyrinomonadaceae bacterium]